MTTVPHQRGGGPWAPWPLLCLAGFFASLSCSARLEDLDACGHLSEAACKRAVRCGAVDLKEEDCEDSVSLRCTAAPGDLATGNADGCAKELEGACAPALPPLCQDLPEDLGCYRCYPGHSPSAAAQKLCCTLDRLSPVCGGCAN